MSDDDKLLHLLEKGDQAACQQCYLCFTKNCAVLAARYLAEERPDHSLSPTALVHEVYLRLTGERKFENRWHFYRAASQAMRRILIDNARHRKRVKRGGGLTREQVDIDLILISEDDDQLIALDEALQQFAVAHERQARLVELRFFGGLRLEEAADALGISLSTADRDWKYARAWLYAAMKSIGPECSPE